MHEIQNRFPTFPVQELSDIGAAISDSVQTLKDRRIIGSVELLTKPDAIITVAHLHMHMPISYLNIDTYIQDYFGTGAYGVSLYDQNLSPTTSNDINNARLRVRESNLQLYSLITKETEKSEVDKTGAVVLSARADQGALFQLTQDLSEGELSMIPEATDFGDKRDLYRVMFNYGVVGAADRSRIIKLSNKFHKVLLLQILSQGAFARISDEGIILENLDQKIEVSDIRNLLRRAASSGEKPPTHTSLIYNLNILFQKAGQPYKFFAANGPNSGYFLTYRPTQQRYYYDST